MIDKETILETVTYMVLTSQNQLLGYSTHLYGTLDNNTNEWRVI